MNLLRRRQPKPPVAPPPAPLIPHQTTGVGFTGNVARQVGGPGYSWAPTAVKPLPCHGCGAPIPQVTEVQYVSSGAMYPSRGIPATPAAGYNITIASGQVYLREIFCSWECVEAWVREKAPGELVGQRLTRG